MEGVLTLSCRQTTTIDTSRRCSVLHRLSQQHPCHYRHIRLLAGVGAGFNRPTQQDSNHWNHWPLCLSCRLLFLYPPAVEVVIEAEEEGGQRLWIERTREDIFRHRFSHCQACLPHIRVINNSNSRVHMDHLNTIIKRRAAILAMHMARHLIRRLLLSGCRLRRCRVPFLCRQTFISTVNHISWGRNNHSNNSSSITHSADTRFRMDRLHRRRTLYWHHLRTTVTTRRHCLHFRVRRVLDLGVAVQPIILIRR